MSQSIFQCVSRILGVAELDVLQRKPAIASRLAALKQEAVGSQHDQQAAAKLV